MLIANLVRKFTQHFFFGASKDKGLRETLKHLPLIVIHFRSVDILILEVRPGSQQTRVDKLHQVPKLSQMILHRRSRKNYSAPGIERHGRLGHSGCAVLDLVRFVETYDIPDYCLKDIDRCYQDTVTYKEQFPIHRALQRCFSVRDFIQNSDF